MMNLNFSQVTNSFLLSVLEGLVDGILILSPDGNLMYANSPATKICQKLNTTSSQAVPDDVPAEVWRSCAALIESRELYGDRPLVIESEFTLNDSRSYRVRVQWLKLDELEQTCLIVRLEDQQQSLQSIAVSEAKLFGLTPREAEVWFLRRCNLSRKEIAARLYITIDTVKKHLGNIQVKRQASQESWC
jgi:DNA-binding CsgD family transcriptional regulator